jgi:hypothetical protein
MFRCSFWLLVRFRDRTFTRRWSSMYANSQAVRTYWSALWSTFTPLKKLGDRSSSFDITIVNRRLSQVTGARIHGSSHDHLNSLPKDMGFSLTAFAINLELPRHLGNPTRSTKTCRWCTVKNSCFLFPWPFWLSHIHVANQSSTMPRLSGLKAKCEMRSNSDIIAKRKMSFASAT